MPSLRDILVMNWRARPVPVCILDSRSTFVRSCFLVQEADCLGMGSPYEHLYGSHGSIYHGFGGEEEFDSDCAVVSSGGDEISARNGVPSHFRNALKSSQQRRTSTQERLSADQATQTPLSYSKTPHICSTFTPSTYSTSSSTIATTLNSTQVKHSTPYKTQKSDSTAAYGRLNLLKSCTRTDSVIELHTFMPAHSYRYPPGIVVIKRLDEQGNEIVELTDLTHQITPLTDLKPTVTVVVDQTGVVQSTKRAGLMERAWERIVDTLARDDAEDM